MKFLIMTMLSLLSLFVLSSCQSSYKVKPISDATAEKYQLDRSFYKKGTMVQNIFIATSDKVSDYAHLESAYIFDMMLQNIKPDMAQRIRS